MAKVPTAITHSPFPIEHGQHFIVTGQTGCGKSAFTRALLAGRPHLVFLRTKPDDIKWSVDRRTTTLTTSIKALNDPRVNRLEIEPRYEEQYDVFAPVLEKLYEQGGRVIVVDEGFEFKRLGLQPVLERFATQGRSKKISLVTCVQRPAWVSRFLISEPSHKISFWHDGRDATTLKDAVSEGHRDAIRGLERFQFVWTAGQPPRSWVGSLNDLA